MTKSQHDSENQVFFQNKKEKHSKTFKTWKMASLGHGQTVFRSTPQRATPSHTVRLEAPCTWLEYPISQKVLRAVNHSGLEWTGP